MAWWITCFVVNASHSGGKKVAPAGMFDFSNLLTCRVGLPTSGEDMVKDVPSKLRAFISENRTFQRRSFDKDGLTLLKFRSHHYSFSFFNILTWILWHHPPFIFEAHPFWIGGSPRSPEYPAPQQSSHRVGQGCILGAPEGQRPCVLADFILWPWDKRNKGVKDSSSFIVGARNKCPFCFPF